MAAPAPPTPPLVERYRLDRDSFETLVGRPEACTDEAIRAALDRADGDDAAVRALARLQAGAALGIELVGELLPRIDRADVFLLLVGRAEGDRVAALTRLLDEQRLGLAVVGAERTVMALFAIWRVRPSEATPVLRRWLRRTLSLTQTRWSLQLACWLADEIQDPDVDGVLGAWEEADDETGELAAASAIRLLERATVAEVVALLPVRDPGAPVPGATARTTPRPGRNDLCPCGSGKKYKRCCADRPVDAGADAAGRHAQLVEVSGRLTREQVHALPLADVAVLDLERLPPAALDEVVQTWLSRHDWTRAAAAIDVVARRQSEPHADDWRHQLAASAIEAGRVDVARAQLDRLTDPVLAEEVRLAIDLATGDAGALDRLRRAAARAIEDDSGVAAVELAYVTLWVDRPLGILLARAALRADRLLDADGLVEAIDEARADLLLPARDPAWDLLVALGGARDKTRAIADAQDERARLAREADELRASLDEARSRLGELERQAADQARELRDAERAVAEASRRAASGDDPERRALRAKIDELKAHIHEGNVERAALRRQVATSAATSAPAATPAGRRGSAAGDARDVDDDEAEALDPATSGTRAVLVPRFAARAHGAIAGLSRQAAAEAVRTVGGLAAGDAGAWRGVKQAKDMPRQVLMARVGIHHRLLFRVDDGALDVLDVVTREALMTTLKHLRG